MNKVIELERDNLNEYMSDEDLLVVFGTKWCKACTKLKPFLYELPKALTIVIVDCEKHLRSLRFMPGGVNNYPTIGFFNKGYFIKEVDHNLILTKQFK
tara:strand:- start:11836 stop:12129 length:294 start_codon:yes stop_codon:yes gene_type:complete